MACVNDVVRDRANSNDLAPKKLSSFFLFFLLKQWLVLWNESLELLEPIDDDVDLLGGLGRFRVDFFDH